MIDIMKLIINEFLIYEGILASVDNEINGFHASYWRSSLGYMKRLLLLDHNHWWWFGDEQRKAIDWTNACFICQWDTFGHVVCK